MTTPLTPTRATRHLELRGPAGVLEAILQRPEGEPRGAAVICHPHPLHGGTMHNKVVFAAARGVLAAGWSALRFNFRGAGRSEGEHDNGRGERLDAAAALTAAAEMHPSLPLLAAGFSFGSVMAMAAGAAQPGVIALAALGLPTRMTAVEAPSEVTLPLLIVQGERDEFAVLEDVRTFSASWSGPADLVVVAGADHFFKGRLDEVESALERFCRRLAERAGPVPAPSGAAPGGGA